MATMVPAPGNATFRSLLEAVPDAIVIVDASGQIVLVNSQTERLFGYTRAELVGQPVDTLVPTAFRRAHPAHRAEYAASPRVRPMSEIHSLTALHKDGREFPAEISLSPLEAPDAHLVIASVRDVSDRRHVEQQLADVRVLASVADQARRLMEERDPVAVLARACRTMRENTQAAHAVAAIFSDDREHVTVLLTDGCDEATTAHLRNAGMLPLFRQIARDQRPRRERLGDGRPERIGFPPSHPWIGSFLAVPLTSLSRVRGVLLVAGAAGGAPFTEADEHAALVLGSQAGTAYENAVLINQLKAQAATLRDGEHLNEFILTASGVGIYERDVKSDRSSTSPSLATLLDLPAEATVDDMRDRLHPDDRGALRAATEAAFADRADFSVDARVLVPGAKVRDVNIRGRVTADAHGDPDRLIGVVIDVSERRQLEAQLRQAQKMEAIGLLAGGVAHDFNNLLTVMGGYARFLEPTLTGAEQQQDLAELLKAVERGATLSRQLLAFSRKRARELSVFSLNTLLTDVAAMLRRLIGEHITLVTTIDPEMPAIHADRGQMEQVLMNLAVNARDAMPGGGELRITTARKVEGDRASAVMVVADTGCGMTPEVQARVFEPFFTTKAEGHGTGLGLSIVSAIVGDAGGRISVDSEPGRGAVFTVRIPASSAPIAIAPAGESEVRGGSERVLLVEDDDGVRSLSAAVLARAGYTVLTAATPSDALALAARERIHVLVSDVLITGGTGPTLYAQLSTRVPGLRVLYVSGYSLDSIIDTRALDATAAFLAKPFTSQALLRRLRALLDRS